MNTACSFYTDLYHKPGFLSELRYRNSLAVSASRTESRATVAPADTRVKNISGVKAEGKIPLSNSLFTQVKKKRRILYIRRSWREEIRRLPRWVPLRVSSRHPTPHLPAPFLLPRNTEPYYQKERKYRVKIVKLPEYGY
jgi:hypothetical protein